jgi:hypothetical protein
MKRSNVVFWVVMASCVLLYAAFTVKILVRDNEVETAAEKQCSPYVLMNHFVKDGFLYSVCATSSGVSDENHHMAQAVKVEVTVLPK